MERQHLLGVILFLLAAFTCVSAQGGGFGCNNTLPANQCSALAAKCNDPAFIPFMLDYCPQTCGLCPKRGCNNTLNANTCQSLAGNCNNTAFQPFMLDYCPATCGFCPTTGGGLCNDVAANCSAIINLCNNPATFQTLTQQCPRTCGRCPATNSSSTLFPGSLTTLAPGTCRDLASNCAANIAQCTNPLYASLMATQCPKTCNLCTIGTTSCVDANTLCPTYVKNGFCNSAAYTQQQKLSNCAKSCNLCSLLG